eukprot:SAG31_NODE_3047_length_4749_cov_3.010968_4_plen_34_part_00
MGDDSLLMMDLFEDFLGSNKNDIDCILDCSRHS